jgi:UDP-N-acetylmuramate dehydrogenase
MDDKIKLIAQTFGMDKVKLDEPLSDYTVLKSTGIAKLFFVAFTTHEIFRMVTIASDLEIPVFVFGTGSKIVMNQADFNGVVIKNRTQNIQVLGVKGKVSRDGIGVEEALIEVEGGVSIKKLVEFLGKQNLETSEIASIPGTIGGNLFLSAPLQRRVKSIKVIEGGEIEEIEIADLSLQKHIVLSAVFRFKSRL